MKTITTIGLVLLFGGTGFVGHAQSITGQLSQVKVLPPSMAYAVTGRDANSRIWKQQTYQLLSSGRVVTNVNSYTELASGLNHLVSGQWLASSEQIVILPNGTAAATNGQCVP